MRYKNKDYNFTLILRLQEFNAIRFASSPEENRAQSAGAGATGAVKSTMHYLYRGKHSRSWFVTDNEGDIGHDQGHLRTSCDARLPSDSPVEWLGRRDGSGAHAPTNEGSVVTCRACTLDGSE